MPQAAMPARRRPAISAPARSTTTVGSRWKARSPIAGQRSQSRSSTGVKERSTPRARTSSQDVADGHRRLTCVVRALFHSALLSHRRQAGKASATTLHPATFVVDGNQQTGTACACTRRSRLEAALVRHSCGRTKSVHRPADATNDAIISGEFGTADVNHQRDRAEA